MWWSGGGFKALAAQQQCHHVDSLGEHGGTWDAPSEGWVIDLLGENLLFPFQPLSVPHGHTHLQPVHTFQGTLSSSLLPETSMNELWTHDGHDWFKIHHVLSSCYFDKEVKHLNFLNLGVSSNNFLSRAEFFLFVFLIS